MIQAIAGQVRALKMVVEQKWGQTVFTSSPIFPWLVMHAAWTHNRFQPVQGSIPYRSVYGHDYRGEVYEVADAMMARVAILPATKLDPRW
eukprot:6374880-Heterocapsa_arctica.AAC.1